ncbi:MAG: hypothetical protein LBL82_02925 [Oscillospiraceae bacterium]|jgi:hypothetical protein|nr:hypothetical protein [Oscillospiraceae bacterium]
MKKTIDIITVVLLVIAFAIAFVTGFIFKKDSGEVALSREMLALISILGMGVIIATGAGGTLVSKIKSKSMNLGFVILFSVQIILFILVCGTMVALLSNILTVNSIAYRIIYILAALSVVAGYLDSVAYSYKLERETEAATAADAEEDSSCEDDGAEENGEAEVIADSDEDGEAEAE